MEKLKNIPSLRFPEFDGEWELKKLGEVAELTSSKRVYANDYVAEGIPFYRGKEITELKENKKPSDILFISKSAYEKFKKSYGVPQINDLLITAVGTLGNVLTIKNNDPFYFKDGNLIWLRNVNQNSIFLEVNLHFNFKEIEKSAIGSSQKALTMVELRKLHFSFPKLTEQTKIASFLTAVDYKLQALKQKKSLLEQYKKGVMQKIFSQELRFKDDNGNDYPNWEEKKLGDVLVKNSMKNKNQEFKLVQSVSNKRGFVNQDEYFEDRIIASKDLSNYYVIQKGDFAYNPSRIDVGSLAYKFDNNTSVISPLYISFKAVGDSLADAFLLEWFTTQEFTRQMNSSFEGSVRNTLSYESLRKIDITFPCIEEQTKIANFLSAIDDKINHCQSQIEKMEVWKKGLLQQMFV